MGRNFANKVWNASRFTVMSLEATEGDAARLGPEEIARARTFEDRWILSRLTGAVSEVTDHLEKFRTNEAAQKIYDFFWHEFCDWYLEEAKLRLRDGADAPARAAARETLAQALDQSLRLLHPFVPYLTEALWQKLQAAAARCAPAAAQAMSADALIASRWPEADPALRDETLEKQMAYLQDIVRAVRHLRKAKDIPENWPVHIALSCPDAATDAVLADHADFLTKMALVEGLQHGVGIAKPPRSATSVVGTTELFLLERGLPPKVVRPMLAGLIGMKAEKERLMLAREDTTEHIAKIEKQLHNPEFLAHAPDNIVQRQKERAVELREKLQKIIQNLAELE